MTAMPSTIIVLCTGRCGSMTLSRACRHLTSHTCEHEGRTHLIGPARFAYPANHIEIDNRLSWLLGRLDQAWGDRAAYIHLTRNREEVAQSFVARASQGILRAYKHDILLRPTRRGAAGTPMIDYCRDYVDTVTANITHFLRDKTYTLDMTLENMSADFETLVGWAGLEGDIEAAQREIQIPHNATPAHRAKAGS